jgi:hypothetical protein
MTTKTENAAAIPSALTADEINVLYQLAKQASIRITDINKIYPVLMHVEQYLSVNLK